MAPYKCDYGSTPSVVLAIEDQWGCSKVLGESLPPRASIALASLERLVAQANEYLGIGPEDRFRHRPVVDGGPVPIQTTAEGAITSMGQGHQGDRAQG